MLRVTSRKLKNKEKLTVAYFGGSITQGAGISDKSKSWRGQTTTWLKEKYPESEIVEIDASLGGTGSDLALFRLEPNVLKYNPDLIFIEFVVNDTILPDCERYEESIIRKILDSGLDCDIVLVRATRDTIYKKTKIGEFYNSYLFYEKLAEKYGFDLVDIGKAFFDIVDAGGSFDDLTVDGVHPSQHGYDVLASVVTKYLEKNIYPFPYLTDDRYMSCTMTVAEDLKNTNFEISNVTFGRLENCLSANVKGKTIEFEFTGTSVGVFYHSASDTGIFEYSIDDEINGVVNTWDEYCKRFDRANYAILTRDLSYGKHKIKITSTGEKCEESKGTYIRIGALLTA